MSMPPDTFLAQVEAEIGAKLSKFVKQDFDAFLECGIQAHGFLRLRYAECTHEKLVAFFLSPPLLRDSCYLLDHGN